MVNVKESKVKGKLCYTIICDYCVHYSLLKYSRRANNFAKILKPIKKKYISPTKLI